jgi:hypothetical protein
MFLWNYQEMELSSGSDVPEGDKILCEKNSNYTLKRKENKSQKMQDILSLFLCCKNTAKTTIAKAISKRKQIEYFFNENI